ncbi:MAG: hypothetical protein JSR98_21465 [Proteobacteria bacterium]|nr:hypothetical protein [Pseudomonadota bacterium]
MSETQPDHIPLDLQEQIARIDNLLAAAAKAKIDVAWQPWQIVITTFGASAAMFAAGATLIKLLWG